MHMGVYMKRFAVLLAIGALVSLGLQSTSYGQVDQFQHQQSDQRFGNFVGSTVYGRGGENLGALSEVVTDPRRPALYGMIRTGGIFGFGVIERPVPWQMFTSPAGGLRSTSTERAARRRADLIQPGNRPDLNHPRWHSGSQLLRRGTLGRRPGEAARAIVRPRHYLYQDIFEPQPSSSGSVARSSGSGSGPGDQMQVSLRTDDGRRIMVSLAPEWYLDNYGSARGRASI